MGTKLRETNRRIRSHILSDTRSISHLAVQLVLVDAVRTGRFADVAGATCKHQAVVDTVFLRVQQVRTVMHVSLIMCRGGWGGYLPFATESKMNLVGLVIASGGRGRAGRHFFDDRLLLLVLFFACVGIKLSENLSRL